MLDNGDFVKSNGDGSYTCCTEENGRIFEERYKEIHLIEVKDDEEEVDGVCAVQTIKTLGFIHC